MGYQNDSTMGEQTKVIIFDWDDTICPSSFFDRQQIEHMDELPSRYHRLFAEIARCAEKCLAEASKYGEVIIITNSDDGWVKYSCERIVPTLLPVIDKYRIVSARTNYEKFYPGQPLCWKAAAFAHEVNETFQSLNDQLSSKGNNRTRCPSVELSDVSSESSADDSSVEMMNTTSGQPLREIISFGDSMEERTAVRIVADQLDAKPKSVMFVSSPTPLEIVGQLQMLTNHMKYVCEHEESLDLDISSEQARRSADSYARRHKLDERLQGELSAKVVRIPVSSASPKKISA